MKRWWCGGGEFGRLPVAQVESKPGRDHNPNAFTTWFAGGGIKGGVSYGETDELGLKASVDKVTIHDLHADDPASARSGPRTAFLQYQRTRRPNSRVSKGHG